MIQTGRLCPIAYSTLSRFIYVFAVIKTVAGIEFGVPIEIKLWDSKRTPLTHMVDVTNEFGLKVLAEHNFLNENNIAFSPYGLMGILVALYEGVDGESSYQIQRTMQLPWNRNVMRIGFRDIHRTLKTYFVPEEGFLAGLALNNENVTFNESYKKVLRFYGFDIDNDQPSNDGTNDTQTTTTILDSSSVNSISTTSIDMTTEKVTAREPSTVLTTEGTKEETTVRPTAETLSDGNIRGPQSTTLSPSTTPQRETTSPFISSETNPTSDVTTQQIPVLSSTTETVAVSTTTTTTTILTTITTPISTDNTIENSGSTSNTNDETISTQSMIIGNTDTDATSTTDSSTTNLDTMPTAQISESEMSSPSTLETQQTDEMSTTEFAETSTIETTIPTTSALETLERRRRSVFDFLYTRPPYANDYLVYRSFDVGVELPEENLEDDKMFLVNGLRNIQVTYMQYNSVLEHAYLPHLEASALRLPLDSERYYLLVVLPNRRGEGELARLLNRMARESDLSDVYAALHPRRVRAVVPSFTVKGHVTLTTDLQKLGIHDVFEPRQHDFTPMTPQAGLYVRSIEQAVSVAIRKYQPDVKNRFVAARKPVFFSATHPFLYFVMDSNIHVALMAGKMVDPLNSRIL